MAEQTFSVTGMTCEHCVHAVRTELTALPGVSAVDVSLRPDAASELRVTSDAPLDVTQVAAALDEAGDYRLAP